MPLGGADDHGWQTTGYEFKPGWDEAEGQEGLRLLEMLNARAAPEACQQELARLALLTKAKNECQEDLTIRLGVLGEELSEFPIDCVRDSCRSWAKSEKWFPSLSELREACQDRAMKRRGLLLALKRYFEGRAAC